MSYSRYFITTAIPYVNSNPHLGHAQEFVLANSLVRYYRGQGHAVTFQSGTDDNASKNILAAQANQISPKEFVDANARKFEELLGALSSKPDYFVRTSSPEHFSAVDQFLRQLKGEDLFESVYRGLYCSGCEDFYDAKSLVNGLCPDHKKAPAAIEEKNIFFRLSSYQQKLFTLIESNSIKITPAAKKKEVLAFIEQGLTDISLSRSALRSQGWGVLFPDQSHQVVYVWIDALINYISGDRKIWREDIYKIHVIGKNVWKFHAIYWPALLLSAGFPLPNEIIIHGFLTNEGTKISKSLGNGVDPLSVLHRYSSDALRFYLLGVLSHEQDGDFVEAKLLDSYNSELANKWGNLVSRVLTLAKDLELELDLPWEARKIPITIAFKDLREQAFLRIGDLNARINSLRPWELAKQNRCTELRGLLSEWLRELAGIAHWLEPLIPEGSAELQRRLQKRGEPVQPLYPRLQIKI